MFEHYFIRNTNSKLVYYFYDTGCKETLFLFHGFGQSNVVFQPYLASFASHFNIIVIDLFFHGESIVDSNTKDFISISEWNSLFQSILEKHSIQSFSCIAYSIGARFVNTLLEKQARQLKRIVFIAPDGFGNTVWFRLVTSTKFTRYLFKKSMEDPSIILLILNVFSFFNLYNQQTIRFIKRNLESLDHRQKIYYTWTYFRNLKIKKSDFVKNITEHAILFLCICGTQDEMVAQDVLKEMCMATSSKFVIIDLPHKKMLEAIQLQAVSDFLIFDRQ